MATRAHQFKSKTEREGPKRAPQVTKHGRSFGPDTSLPGISATDKKWGGVHTAARNPSLRGARKATVELEDSTSGHPSRKSTRASKNHGKPASALQRKAQSAKQTPESRARRAAAGKKSGPRRA